MARWWTGRTPTSTSPRTSSTTGAASSKAPGATTRSTGRRASVWTRICAACSTRRASTGWSPTYDQQTLTDATISLIQTNGFKACYIRPIDLPRLRLAWRGPARLPDRRGDHPLGVAGLLHQGSDRRRHRRQDCDLGAQCSQHHAGDGEKRRQLRQRSTDQARSGQRGLRRRDRARYQWEFE